MTINVSKANTKLYKYPDGGWVRAEYDTGEIDEWGKPVLVVAIMPMAALEVSEGVFLSKPQARTIVERALRATQPPPEVELNSVL